MLQTKIYNHNIINDDKIRTQIHFIITNKAGASANANAYITKQINQKIISHRSHMPTLVLAKKYKGFIGKLR
jgi:hypothetical protein